MQASKTTNSAQTQRRYGPGGDSAIGTHNGRMVARLQRDISFHSFTSPGPGLDLHLDYTCTWTWTWTSPGHQRFLQIRCLLRFLHQLHLLHLDLLLLSLPRPVIKLVQLQVSWPSEREQRGPILTQPRHLEPRDSSKFRFLLRILPKSTHYE